MWWGTKLQPWAVYLKLEFQQRPTLRAKCIGESLHLKFIRSLGI